jgi:teichuronic acid biosynthesis glycosyltransferase TuaC
VTHPPRVLVLCRSYPSDVFPALGLWVERPTTLLAGRCDVRVVSPVPYSPPLPRLGVLGHYASFRGLPKHEVRNGIEVLRPRFLIGPGRSLQSLEPRLWHLGVRRTVARLRDEFPFDLVHAHFIFPEGAVARRIAERYGVPLVVSEHAPWTEVWFERPAVRREALAAAAAAAAFVPVSEYVRDTIVAYTGDGTRTRIVPVGVDGELFVPAAPEARRPDQILFVGWPNFNKGVDVLLHAVAKLKQREIAARLLIVGGSYYRNTQRQELHLRELASTLGLLDRVTFTGSQPHSEVARLMAESAVLALPSRAETFGAVLVEALATGTPVVATRSGGPEEIVSPEVGVLVSPDDPAALAEALADVLRVPDRYDPEALRRYALERYAWPRLADQLYDVYAGALGRATSA